MYSLQNETYMDFFGYPLWVVLAVCVGVFCAGFMDAIGGGGGIISLPSYLLAGVPMHLSLGTNTLSSCIGTVASTVRYIKNGYVDWLLGIPSIGLALVGAVLAWQQTGFGDAFLPAFLFNGGSVALGEAAVCFILGLVLLRTMEKTPYFRDLSSRREK